MVDNTYTNELKHILKYPLGLKTTMDTLLSTNKLAVYLDITPATVRRKAHNGEIPSIKVGNRLRFDKQQVDKWILQNSRGKRMSILVIDDEPVVGQLFRDSLNKPDYAVTTTLNSLEALELLGIRHFDFVFLNPLIPEIGGAELFRRIKLMDKSVPVAIITSNPDSDLMRKAMGHGPFTVLQKPFTYEEIVSTVRSFVEV